MNSTDLNRINILANKLIDGTINAEEEQEFVYLYSLYNSSNQSKND
ncbi:hypothetical protein [Thalassotalea aquiviva]